MSAAPNGPREAGHELEAILATVAAIALGPFTLLIAVGIATFARSRSRIWLWAAGLPSAAAGWLLWPTAQRHLELFLRTLHATLYHSASPQQALATAWPELWPAWLATTVLSPLVAFVIVLWQGPLPLSDPSRSPERHPRVRRERRVARKAAKSRPAHINKAGLFLGYSLEGDPLLPTRHGRVYLPLLRLSHHLLVAGATGSGKTETVLRIADSLARTSDWTIVYIDGKGDQQNKQRFAQLMADAGRRVWLFPDEPYDGWRGTTPEIAGRLLQLIDFADQGGGTYYRDLAVNTIRLACESPDGPPRSSTELLARLQHGTLTSLHPEGSPAAAEIAALPQEQLAGIRARYAAFFNTLAGSLDGQTAFEQLDSAYFLLDGLRLKYEAGYLARFLVEEFTQWAVARKPRRQNVLLIVDEFSAIAQAGQGLVDVVERTRGFGVAAILCPQLAEGMGSPEAAARIIGSAQTILLHQMATPEQLVRAGGTRRVHFATRQLEGEAFTGRGSTRVEDEYRADPNEVRRLKPGQCFAIGSGLAMKLQIAAAPPAKPHTHASMTPPAAVLPADAGAAEDGVERSGVSLEPVGPDDLDHAAHRPVPVQGRSPTSLTECAPAGRPTGGDTPIAPLHDPESDGRLLPRHKPNSPERSKTMNTIQLIGRLTANPEASKTPTGKSVCRMRLAVDGPKADATIFVDVETWNKLAEACDQHLEKGRRVSVLGRLAHDQWQTDDGQRRQRHYIVASNVEFLDARPNGVKVEAQPEQAELEPATA